MIDRCDYCNSQFPSQVAGCRLKLQNGRPHRFCCALCAKSWLRKHHYTINKSRLRVVRQQRNQAGKDLFETLFQPFLNRKE